MKVMEPHEGQALELHKASNSIKNILAKKKYNLAEKDSIGDTALHAQEIDIILK